MGARLKPRTLTFCLSLALAIKASRGLAQEDYGAFRTEFYREDDNRMSIDTQSAAFDLGLCKQVRLTGEFTYDAISGATPTGAPPVAQWPKPTYGTYYNQVLLATANDPNNYILYQSGYFPNFQAYTNYIAQNNPQLGTQATNLLNLQKQILSTNALYRSGKVPLTEMRDIRRAFSFGLPVSLGISTFTPSIAISKESDYHSYGFALNYTAVLNKKNTTLNAGWSHDVDRVRDWTETVWAPKVSDNAMIGINQLLTPKSYLTVDLTYGQEYGYLDDPYRGVMFELNNPQLPPFLDAALFHENRPRRRTDQIAYTTYTHFIDPLRGSAVVGYRFFHDSYGIFAQTGELTWNQKLGNYVTLSPGFRYYFQTAAHFYAIIFPDADNPPPNYSSDYRLSRMQTLAMSVNLDYRVQKHVALDFNYMRYVMQGLDGVTSQSAYPSANVGSFGLRLIF